MKDVKSAALSTPRPLYPPLPIFPPDILPFFFFVPKDTGQVSMALQQTTEGTSLLFSLQQLPNISASATSPTAVLWPRFPEGIGAEGAGGEVTLGRVSTGSYSVRCSSVGTRFDWLGHSLSMGDVTDAR